MFADEPSGTVWLPSSEPVAAMAPVLRMLLPERSEYVDPLMAMPDSESRLPVPEMVTRPLDVIMLPTTRSICASPPIVTEATRFTKPLVPVSESVASEPAEPASVKAPK